MCVTSLQLVSDAQIPVQLGCVKGLGTAHVIPSQVIPLSMDLLRSQTGLTLRTRVYRASLFFSCNLFMLQLSSNTKTLTNSSSSYTPCHWSLTPPLKKTPHLLWTDGMFR